MNFILKRLSTSAKAHEAEFAKQMDTLSSAPAGLKSFPDLPYFGQDGAPLAADAYRPGEHSGLLPVAVMVHGGGLFAGDRKINRAFCEILAMKGFLVFSIEYRTIDKADACGEISDVCAGFSFATEKLTEYGGDPNRVSVIAESAGAFLSVYATASTNAPALAGRIGCEAAELRIRALICFSGMFYTTRADLIGAVYRSDLYGARRKDKEFMRRMNPEYTEVMSTLPPVLLTSSRADFLRRYTLRYAKALKEAGHPCRLLYYKEGKELIHAFPSLNPLLPESGEVMEKVLAWLKSLNAGQDG